MAELGSGSGSGYPGAIDTDTTQEVNSPNAGRTKARAEVINDAYAAIVALQTELGTDPAGSLTDVKTWLQTEHGADGTHDATKIVEIAGAQTITGVKTFSAIVKTAKGADVASAGALTLLTDGNAFDITGTTSITSIGTLGIGTIVILEFDGALTLTHHATDLILPTGANITTAAGDIAIMYEYATGDWRCVSWSPTSGLPLASTFTGVVSGSNLLTTAGGTTGAPTNHYIDNMVSCYAVISTDNSGVHSGGGAAIEDGFNIASWTAASASVVTVVFNTALANANYNVHFTTSTASRSTDTYYISAQATTGFTLTFSSSNIAVNKYHLTVIGGQ